METHIETALRKQIRFDEKEQILYRRVQGLGDVKDILNSFEILMKDKMLPRELSIIDDSTKAKFVIDVSELEFVVEKIEKIASTYILIRHAVIHSDPENTALTIVIGNSLKSDNYFFDVFSTEEAAKKWVRV